MKKSFLILLLLTLLLSTQAFALRVSYDSIQEEVLPGQAASYTVHLTNDDDQDVTVTIKSIDLAWQMDKDSTSYEVDAGETYDVVVTYTSINPTPAPTRYGLNFQASTKETKETKLLPVLIVDYKDTLEPSFSSLPVIDPRRSTIVKLLLTNKHNILLEDIEVTLKSEFFEETQTVTLQGKEQRELEFPITLDPETIEGEYTLNAIAHLGDKELLDQEFLYSIGKYSNVREIVQPEEGFLLTGARITQTNEGNAVVSETYSEDFGLLSYYFTSFQPEPTSVVKTDGRYNVVWNYNLAPGESLIIDHTTNYRKPILFTLLILAALVAFYFFSKKYLEVDKRVLVLHTTQGGMAIMKVVIAVRNPGKTTIRTVSVMDKVPHNIKAPTDFGIIKPVHVKSTPEGMRIIWELPSLKPGEEKTLTYKIESKMNLSQQFTLPGAAAKFMSGAKKVIATSPAVSIKPK